MELPPPCEMSKATIAPPAGNASLTASKATAMPLRFDWPQLGGKPQIWSKFHVEGPIEQRHLKKFGSERENMICPKCSYERKPTDSAPEYECPACGIIYAKYKPTLNAIHREVGSLENPPSPIGKILATKAGKIVLWLIGVALLLALIAKSIGAEFAILAVFAPLAIWAILKAIEGSRKQEEKRKEDFAKQPWQHCMTCGHDFRYDHSALRGSKTMEIALWIFLLWPIALIYTIWRRLGAGKAKIACIVCASNQVVPETSPAAIAHKKALGTNS